MQERRKGEQIRKREKNVLKRTQGRAKFRAGRGRN